MDQIDLELLAALERDGRQSFAMLADATGLSKTPCWLRVQKLEKAGAIRGYSADLDPTVLGLKVLAYVEVMIDFAQREAFETAVLANPAIIECTTMAGEADYMFKLVCADVDRLDDLLRHQLSLLPGVQRSKTMICLKTIKRGAPLTAAIGRARPG